MNDDTLLPIDGGDLADDPALAQRLAELYRNTPAPDAEVAGNCARAVLQKADTSRANPFRRQQRWWWGGAAAAALVLAVTMRTVSTGKQDTPVDTTLVGNITPVDNGAAMQFELKLPSEAARNADKVSVVGDFNGWDTAATPMAQSNGKGAWSAKVPLSPGRHVYAYVINGERWIVDPLAPQVPDAGYGPANALVVEGGTK